MPTNIVTATYPDGKIDEKSVFWHEAGEQLPEVTLRQIPSGEEWQPQVGDGCSYGHNGDSYPYTAQEGRTVPSRRQDLPRMSLSESWPTLQSEPSRLRIQ